MKISNYATWFRPWIILSGMSFIGIVIWLVFHHFNAPSNPCLAFVNFEHVLVTVSPQTTPAYPYGRKFSFPVDATPAEIAEFLTKELRLDTVIADRISRTARVDINDDDLDFSGNTNCPAGYAMPVTKLRNTEPYATLIHQNGVASTLSLSRTLFTIWLLTCAATAGVLALALWIIGRFQERKKGRPGAVLPSQLTRSTSPATASQNIDGGLAILDLEQKESKVRLIMEALLHSFAASLAVPIVNAAGFGGAIPVIAVGLIFGTISMATVRIVRNKIANHTVRRTVLLSLPFAYFFIYAVLYVGIRSS